METVATSGQEDLAEELVRFFVEQGEKECFAASLFTCYEQIKPEVGLAGGLRAGGRAGGLMTAALAGGGAAGGGGCWRGCWGCWSTGAAAGREVPCCWAAEAPAAAHPAAHSSR
jgi:hypothetical protein